MFTDYLLRGGGAKETQKNRSLHFHWTALVDCQLSSEKLTFQHLSVGSNILKCWKGETKNFSCAVFLSDLMSHMFPSGMHKKSLWIIHKHLGRNQLILLNKKVGQKKLTAAVLLCSILKKRTPEWERIFPSIIRTVYIKYVRVYNYIQICIHLFTGEGTFVIRATHFFEGKTDYLSSKNQRNHIALINRY